MANLTKNKNLRKLKVHHDYLNKKVTELTKDRKKTGVPRARRC